MSDLISRADAIKALYKYGFVSKNVIEREINAIPSADAVEVVRCKDCKYGEYRQDLDDYECGVDGCGLVYDAGFYCSDGERREP